jgi:hypothetical protein
MRRSGFLDEKSAVQARSRLDLQAIAYQKWLAYISSNIPRSRVKVGDAKLKRPIYRVCRKLRFRGHIHAGSF